MSASPGTKRTPGPANASTPTPTSHQVVPFSTLYFQLCAIGGAVACGPTHMSVTPLDVVKCNAQTNPEYFGKGTLRGLRSIYIGEVAQLGFTPGIRGVLKGWGPTLVGYSFQGAGKYGFYEYFAYHYSKYVGDENAKKYRVLVWGAASASAEFFADMALCPFEAVKDGMPKMIKTEGFSTLYAGIIPLWARQIPYTVVKFVSFEAIAEEIYSFMPKKKEDMSVLEQLGVVFSAGYLAGILCATASHPADVLVSKINKVQTSGSFFHKASIIVYGSEGKPGIGMKGLWVGLGTRIVMIGTLTGLQWLLYGAFKNAAGLPTPGGH